MQAILLSGVWKISYRHTGDDVVPGMTVSQTQAEELLRQDLEKFESYVEDAVAVQLEDSHPRRPKSQ